MSGYFTDKRSVPRQMPGTYFLPDGRKLDASISYTDLQTTYSFRSSRAQEIAQLAESWRNTTINGFTEMSTKQDTGHPFRTFTQIENYSHEHVSSKLGSERYVGALSPVRVGVAQDYPAFSSMPIDEIKLYGNKAIKKTSPTYPEVNLSTSAAELFREGLPSYHLKTPYFNSQGKFDSKNIGSDYLGAVFTWQPFITDVLRTIKALVSASETLTQYSRDSGRLVRRRYHFKQERSTTVSEPTGGAIRYSGFPTSLYQPTSETRRFLVTSQTITSRWFSGAFIYYINAGDSLLDRLAEFEQKGNRLLGLRITPETLWELIPWSWLVDWFVCIQDALAVSTSLQTDGLVLKYGYLMRHQVLKNTYTVTGAPVYGATVGAVRHSYTVVQKERVKATPYGFGVNLSGLSSSQWAILAALGLTKAPNILP